MNRLLASNFSRLLKSKVFWITIAGMLLYGVGTCISSYQNQIKYDTAVTLDGIFFLHMILIGAFCAVFCSLFIGTEYSDGTIRNKLMIGHRRSSIYLSNLIVSSAAGLLMCLIYFMTVSAIGIPLFGFLQTDPKIIWLMILNSALLIISYCSVFTMLSMLSQNKAVVAVISIIGFFVLFFLAMNIYARLSAPEFYESYIMGEAVGDMTSQAMANPQFLRGSEREIWQFFFDFLPTGQAAQISNLEAVHPFRLPLYSLAALALTAVPGILAFRKKDIK